MATSAEMLTGGLGLLAAGTLAGEWSRLDIAAITPRSWWGLAYLITCGALIGFVAYTWLLRNAPTPLVTTYAYVNPLVAIFMGNLLGEEAITPQIIFSAAMIVGAVILISWTKPSPAKPPAQIRLPTGDD